MCFLFVFLDEIYNETVSRFNSNHAITGDLDRSKTYEIWVTSIGLKNITKSTEKVDFSLPSGWFEIDLVM